VRKVCTVRTNSYTIPKLSELAEKFPQTTHFRIEVYLQIAWPVVPFYPLTFHKKFYKDAQAKNLYTINFILCIGKNKERGNQSS
jgi:hypothetical protein